MIHITTLIFLGSVNFFKSFIQSFNKIVELFISILQTTDNKDLSLQAYKNIKNQDISNNTCSNNSSNSIGRNIENLLTIIKLIKFKKSNLAKSKKSDLTKAKKLHFAKPNFFEIDFLIFGAKKIFIYL